ncbi:MAG: PIN domain-containing protein, partial [Chloroflexi bacterium]|nr:PIN domain-containing protein [Chloroflexota bacterium]
QAHYRGKGSICPPQVWLSERRGRAMPLRAVIDTNVLFSPRLRAELQELALQGVFTAIWSPWIIAELNRVLVWQWITERTNGDLSSANERACSRSAKRMMVLLLGALRLSTRALHIQRHGNT